MGGGPLRNGGVRRPLEPWCPRGGEPVSPNHTGAHVTCWRCGRTVEVINGRVQDHREIVCSTTAKEIRK